MNFSELSLSEKMLSEFEKIIKKFDSDLSDNNSFGHFSDVPDELFNSNSEADHWQTYEIKKSESDHAKPAVIEQETNPQTISINSLPIDLFTPCEAPTNLVTKPHSQSHKRFRFKK